MAFCVECGFENDDKNNFCSNCGKSLINKSSKILAKDISEILDFKIECTDETPESFVKELEENVKHGCIENVTDLEMDDRIKAGNIIADGFKNKTMPNEIINQIDKELNINRDDAESIAQTETMRSLHASSYREALRDGMTHYVIDNRAESCIFCREKEGNVFFIDDKKNIPPFHSKCACIPVYFYDEEDAEDWAKSLKNEKNDIRQKLVSEGKVINDDGTSSHTNN